ncbi:MAG: NAD(P)/FAD-dependent oxidoreductase [Brevefilum sp.]|nr:NAD(P)/FAD-dependent oxidoreductase [Brevefilum sp.]
MKSYKYIIIGGGMTGSAAVMGIRKNDPDGSIAMFSKEPFQPYNRPPLTKGLWDGKDVESIVRPMGQYQVDLFLEKPIEQIIPDQKQVRTTGGETFGYEKLLLATGGDPIQLPGMPDGVIAYRTRVDYHLLENLVKEKDSFCIIGGGFIGSELAAALVKKQRKVSMIFPETGICGDLFPEDLSDSLVHYYQEKGVKVLKENLVDVVNKNGDQYTVQYHNIEDHQVTEAPFDVVIVGIGIKPNTALAEAAGIDVDNGIIVNETLQTNFSDIFAAGDVANFKHIPLGKRVRVEHEDNANTMGMLAGQNMSGELQTYDHFPFFYSDLFDLGYEAVGDFGKDLEIYEDWIDPFKKGTIFYLKDDKIRGVIFWNLWGKVDGGRELIRSGKSYTKADLKGMFEG